MKKEPAMEHSSFHDEFAQQTLSTQRQSMECIFFPRSGNERIP